MAGKLVMETSTAGIVSSEGSTAGSPVSGLIGAGSGVAVAEGAATDCVGVDDDGLVWHALERRRIVTSRRQLSLRCERGTGGLYLRPRGAP